MQLVYMCCRWTSGFELRSYFSSFLFLSTIWNILTQQSVFSPYCSYHSLLIHSMGGVSVAKEWNLLLKLHCGVIAKPALASWYSELKGFINKEEIGCQYGHCHKEKFLQQNVGCFPPPPFHLLLSFTVRTKLAASSWSFFILEAFLFPLFWWQDKVFQ